MIGLPCCASLLYYICTFLLNCPADNKLTLIELELDRVLALLCICQLASCRRLFSSRDVSSGGRQGRTCRSLIRVPCQAIRPARKAAATCRTTPSRPFSSCHRFLSDLIWNVKSTCEVSNSLYKCYTVVSSYIFGPFQSNSFSC